MKIDDKKNYRFEIMPSWGCMKTISSVTIQNGIIEEWVKIYRFL